MITLANAPVSYGVFGLARPDLVPLPTGAKLLQLVREAGYDGIDLGVRLFRDESRNNLGLAGRSPGKARMNPTTRGVPSNLTPLQSERERSREGPGEWSPVVPASSRPWAAAPLAHHADGLS